jgi:diaminopimelate epimerase
MKIPFVKMHGTGNDFIIIERNDIRGININDYSKYLNDRHFGIGGDGLLIVDKSDSLYKMTMINPDGSEAMCGNGIRCFALYLLEKNYEKNTEFEVDSIAGVKKIQWEKTDNNYFFSVDMGNPIFERSKIPMSGSGKSPVIDEKLIVDNADYYATCVSMGNPHAVIFVDDYNSFSIDKVGKSIENNQLFPKRTNVEFVKVIDRNNIVMRVWERGAGQTLACGTGTCASVVAASLKGLVEDKVTVQVLGGILHITYIDDNVIMKGEAKTVFTGTIDIE